MFCKLIAQVLKLGMLEETLCKAKTPTMISLGRVSRVSEVSGHVIHRQSSWLRRNTVSILN